MERWKSWHLSLQAHHLGTLAGHNGQAQGIPGGVAEAARSAGGRKEAKERRGQAVRRIM